MGIEIVKEVSPREIAESFLVGVDISREEVKRGDLKKFKSIAKSFEQCGVQGKGKMMLVFSGYDDDPAEIYNIQPIRKWVAKVFKAVPHFIYWLSPLENNDVQIIACLGNPTSVRFGADDKKTTVQYLAEGARYEEIPKVYLSVELPKELEEDIVRAVGYYAFWLKENKQAVVKRVEQLLRVAQIEK